MGAACIGGYLCGCAAVYFCHGVWYMYSYEAFDKDGNEIAGTQNSIVELNLEFQSGRWILVNKLEEP